MLPHKATGKIPYEVFFDLPAPSFDRYKVFGCIIERLVDEETRPAQSMWDQQANRHVYIRTDSRSGYEYRDLTSQRFAHTHNCTFFENEFPLPDEFPTLQMEPRMRKRARVVVPPVSQEERQPQQQVSPESQEQEPMQEIVVQNGPPPEENRPPPHESNVAQSKHPVNDNPSFEEARAGPDAETWKRAMLEEYGLLNKMKYGENLHSLLTEKRSEPSGF